jgi:hypothetical protein
MSVGERFWAKVRKTVTCWLWEGSKNEDGYGRVRVNRRLYKAHRVSFELFYGTIPDGMVVMHGCDNPACVNPAHLSAGTILDNVADMDAKGRRHAKLSDKDVSRMRRLREFGWSYERIAAKFGIDDSSVWYRLNGGRRKREDVVRLA